MKTIFNFLWSITLGLILWILYMTLSFLFSLTVVLDPIGKSMRQIAKIILWPFGKSIIRDKNQSTYAKNFGRIFNIIWFPFGLIFSIIHIIFGLFACLTIVGIPTGIVLFKIAKAIVFPIGIKVVNQKELVQEMVKEELQKHGNQNNVEYTKTIDDSNLSIEDKSKLYDEMVNGKNKEIPLKKSDTSVSMTDVFKPLGVFKKLKPIIGILALLGQTILFVSLMFEIKNIFHFIIVIILILYSLVQLFSYIIPRFKLEKYINQIIKNDFLNINYNFILFITSLFFIFLVNILILGVIIFDSTIGFLEGVKMLLINNIFILLYQYIFGFISYNNLGKIDGVIKELEKFEKYNIIMKVKIFVIKFIKPKLVK